jgi:16S rRNA (guanine966-N2)-methyltransferase
LGQDLAGKACLDLFAGSGALGFEAASRGAAPVMLVEQAPAVVKALHRNATALAADRVEIVRADALQFAASATRRFDVVFVDPPYQQGWLAKILPGLFPLLTPDAVVYAEAEHTLTVPGWSILRQGRAGHVHFHLLQPATAGS